METGKTLEKQPCAFITGITGQCGSFLADILIEKGYKVVGLRRRTSTFNTERVEHLYDNPNFIMEWGDMNDSHSLWRIITKYKPDYIYNAAAQSHVRVSFDVPEETLNVVGMGTLKLLNVCKETLPDVKIFHFSSSEMFGDNTKVPQNEKTRMTPASPYAAAKLFAHNICRNYRLGYGMKIYCGIIFNNESERRGETFVTRKITRAAAKIKLGKQHKLFLGNLEAKRDWGYSKEYMEVIVNLMESNTKPDDFVIATGETHSVKEFLDEVFKLAGLDPNEYVEIDDRLFRPHEVPLLLGDPTKIKNAIGWEPKIKFKELAKIMYESDLEKEIGL